MHVNNIARNFLAYPQQDKIQNNSITYNDFKVVRSPRYSGTSPIRLQLLSTLSKKLIKM